MSDYARPDALVTTAWLNEHLHDPDLRVLDVDEDTTAYQKGHIPGAVGVHWKDDLQDPIQRDFVGPEGFGRLMDRYGVTRDTRVVLYGGNKNWFAAYAYWYFTYYGHPRVQLLDGGRRKWELDGLALTTDVTPAAPTAGYRPGPGDAAIRIFRDDVAGRILGRPDAALVDVRSPEEFRGERLTPDHLPNEAAQKPGHIPGARNIPWSKAVHPEQETFLPADELRALYGGEGVTPDKDVVAYCRIGERSAHTWFVLHELLGYPQVRNYDGSWTEWGSLVRAPIER